MNTQAKPHFNILDGLRGAAALMVVWYHVFEGFAFASGGAIESFNHGYLAVDFFFMLSGFVISYAYDSRWGKGLSTWEFFKRRLIRLHPMVIMGAIIGAISFLIGGSLRWDGSETPFGWVMAAMLMGMLLLPAWPGARYDVRGNGELYSLNGPTWSLFFEYIGNILYALFIRRLSGRALAVLVAVLGAVMGWFAVTDVSGYGMIGVGWTLDTVNFFGGLVRMLFPFTLGMLMARNFCSAAQRTQDFGPGTQSVRNFNSGMPCAGKLKPVKVRGIFWIAIALLGLLFSVPYVPACGNICLNGAYEMLCVMIFFPVIIWLGASGDTESTWGSGVQGPPATSGLSRAIYPTTDKISTGICKFLGELSYPLYVVHYPVMYLFYQWLIENKIYTLDACWPVVLGVIATSLLLAWLTMKFWETPVRKWLGKK